MALTAELKIGSGYGPPGTLAFDPAGEGRHVRAWCQDGAEAGEVELIARIAHVLPQVVEALAWRHARGIAYGRLTADAVWVDPDGRVALAAQDAPRGPRVIPEDVAAFGRLARDLLAGVRSAPPESLAWIERLMDPDPGQRPSLVRGARGLLAPLGGRAPFRPRPLPRTVDLIGREGLERGIGRRLAAVSDGGFRLVVLTGPMGVGKSCLAQGAARAFEAGGGLVLRGRARPRERRAFGAVAEAVDALTMVLGRRYGGARSATEAFLAAGDGVRRRRDYFDEVVRLLRSAAQTGAGVVLLVEDLQWADDDSLALLEHLVCDGPERVAVLATLADDHGRCAASDWLDERPDADRLDVAPLDEADSRRVLERAMAAGASGRQDGEPDEPAPEDLQTALDHGGGLPALAELAGRELARGGAHRRRHTLLEGVGSDVRDLPEDARRILALVLAADDWIERSELARLMDRSLGELAPVEDALTVAGLLRRAGADGPGAALALAHETVRLAVRQGLTRDERAAAHARFAAQLRRGGGAAPERVVRHLLGAGKRASAARIARVAALSAERLGAYGLAADMYEVALGSGSEGVDALVQSRARALERSGRVHEAAQAWERLADQGDTAVHEVAGARAADALLAAGELAQAGRRLASTPRGAQAALLAARPAGLLDPRRGTSLLDHAGAASLAAGDRQTSMRAAALRAVQARLTAEGWRGRREADALRAQADALAPPLPWRLLLVGAQVLAEDRPRDSRPRLIEAAGALADAGLADGPERRIALVLAMEASRRTGDAGLLWDAAQLAREALPDAPDLELACDAALAEALALAADHEADAARARLTVARRSLPDSPPTLPGLRLAAAALLNELGAASPTTSRARLADLLRQADRRPLRLRPLHGQRGGLLAAIAARVEAAALRAGDRRASPRRLRHLLVQARRCSTWDGEFGMAPAA